MTKSKMTIPHIEDENIPAALLLTAMRNLNEQQKKNLAYNLFVRLSQKEREEFISDYKKGIGIENNEKVPALGFLENKNIKSRKEVRKMQEEKNPTGEGRPEQEENTDKVQENPETVQPSQNPDAQREQEVEDDGSGRALEERTDNPPDSQADEKKEEASDEAEE